MEIWFSQMQYWDLQLKTIGPQQAVGILIQAFRSLITNIVIIKYYLEIIFIEHNWDFSWFIVASLKD